MRATHNRFLYGFFSLYTRMRIKAAFRNVVIEGKVTDRGLPVLVVANHFSWWDGFWIMYMNMKLFRRKFYFMMLEEQLRKHIFFNKTGGYSVRKGSKSIVESIRYTIDLLNEKGNMVLLFPQGEIESAYLDKIDFEKGALRIISQVAGKAQVVFAANLVEYFSRSRPSLYMYLEEYKGAGDPEAIEGSYNEFYFYVLRAHKERKEEG